MMNTTQNIPTESEFDALGNTILHRANRADQHRRRRSIGIIASIAAAAVLTGTGAVVLATTEMQRNVTYCYQYADLGSAHTQVGNPTDLRDAQGRVVDAAVGDAVDKCAAVWRIGFFETAGVPAKNSRVYPVPDLQLCMRSDGVPAVLPRDGFTGTDSAFCHNLGLALP